MSYQITVQPATEPVDVADCKLVARLTATGLDGLIEDLFIPSARRTCEQRLGRSLITQTIRKTLDAWPADGDIELEYGPVASITSVSYLDANGDSTLVDSDLYSLDSRNEVGSAWVLLAPDQIWPTTGSYANAVSVLYVAGYGGASDVPHDVRLWIMAAVAEMIRTGNPDVPRGFADGLLDRCFVAKA